MVIGCIICELFKKQIHVSLYIRGKKESLCYYYWGKHGRIECQIRRNLMYQLQCNVTNIVKFVKTRKKCVKPFKLSWRSKINSSMHISQCHNQMNFRTTIEVLSQYHQKTCCNCRNNRLSEEKHLLVFRYKCWTININSQQIIDWRKYKLTCF